MSDKYIGSAGYANTAEIFHFQFVFFGNRETVSKSAICWLVLVLVGAWQKMLSWTNVLTDLLIH